MLNQSRSLKLDHFWAGCQGFNFFDKLIYFWHLGQKTYGLEATQSSRLTLPQGTSNLLVWHLLKLWYFMFQVSGIDFMITFILVSSFRAWFHIYILFPCVYLFVKRMVVSILMTTLSSSVACVCLTCSRQALLVWNRVHNWLNCDFQP